MILKKTITLEENELNKLRAEVDEFTPRVAELTKNNEELKRNIAENESKVKELTDALAEKEKAFDDQKSRLEKAETELSALKPAEPSEYTSEERLVCPKCGSTLNSNATEKIVMHTIPKGLENAYKPFIYALNRYIIKEHRYIKVNLEGINYKDLDLYNNRIVIRQLNQDNLICAAYEKNALSSQSVYNIKINKSPIPEFNHFYLLGLLNSRLLSYYFIKTFGSYKSLFPRILIEKINDFPIKVPISNKEKENAKKIIENVKLILENFDELEHLQETIDLLVFDLYEITDNNRKYILNYLKTLNS